MFTDMGQGAITGLLQGVAEELEVEWSALRYEMAPVRAAYSAPWGYSTGGSRSVRRLLLPFRQIAAAARVMLIQAAAARWGVEAGTCTAAKGRVYHAPSTRELSYAELAADAASLRAPSDVALKPSSSWRVLGQSLREPDLRAKVSGEARYGIDVQMPDLLVAAILTLRGDSGSAEQCRRGACAGSAWCASGGRASGCRCSCRHGLLAGTAGTQCAPAGMAWR